MFINPISINHNLQKTSFGNSHGYYNDDDDYDNDYDDDDTMLRVREQYNQIPIAQVIDKKLDDLNYWLTQKKRNNVRNKKFTSFEKN